MIEPKTPLFVLLKDCGEVESYGSVEALLGQLEAIDVENNEYEVWDAEGRKVLLRTEESGRFRSKKIVLGSVEIQLDLRLASELSAKVTREY